ncbi:uncharacterized mitochondrial protein-like protein [Tanacetum coccineum]
MDYITAPRAWLCNTCQHIMFGHWDFKKGKLTRLIHQKAQIVIFCLPRIKTAKHTNGNSKRPQIKDEDGEEVDVHMYRSMISSLMYLTSSRPNIMFVVYACARYQVNLKVSHLHVVKKIFRYLKGQPKLGLWYPKDSPFDLVAYTDSDYARASLDRKSTTGGCQFLRCRLISWQCKKQTVVTNYTTEAEYVAASRKAKKSVKLMMEKLFRMELELMILTQKSDGFEQIVDFLNAHPIKYALTVNPTIYTSCIEQFWSTVKVKTINGESQLHFLVDGKKIIITESPVRRDLQLADENGDLDNSTNNILIPLDSWTSGLLVYRLPLSVEYGVSTSIGYGVSSSLSNTAYSSQQINTAYPLPLDTAYRSSGTETKIIDFRAKFFLPSFGTNPTDCLSLVSDFNLLSDKEYSEEEEEEAMAETMEQYMSKTRTDYGSGVARPKIDNKDQFELKGQFLKELRENTFSGSDNEDANEHIEKVLEIVDLFHVPNITFLNKYCPPSRTAKKMEEINNFQQEPDENLYQAWELFKELLMKCPQHYLTEMQEVILFYNGLDVPTRQILDSRGVVPTKTAADAKIAIQEMAEYSQKWHNGTSRGRSTKTSDGLAAIQAQLNNLGREIKKVNEKVYAA